MLTVTVAEPQRVPPTESEWEIQHFCHVIGSGVNRVLDNLTIHVVTFCLPQKIAPVPQKSCPPVQVCTRFYSSNKSSHKCTSYHGPFFFLDGKFSCIRFKQRCDHFGRTVTHLVGIHIQQRAWTNVALHKVSCKGD